MTRKRNAQDATRLLRWLWLHKITQAELARRLKQDPRTINRTCLRGAKTTRIAQIYAQALNCNPLDIIEL